MLNGDYAAELPGSGINAQGAQDRVLLGNRSGVRDAGTECAAGCPAAPGLEPLQGLWWGCGCVRGCVVSVCVCACTSVLISHLPAER